MAERGPDIAAGRPLGELDLPRACRPAGRGDRSPPRAARYLLGRPRWRANASTRSDSGDRGDGESQALAAVDDAQARPRGPTHVSAAFRLLHPLVWRAVYEVCPAAGGSPLTAARATPCAPAGATRRGAHHVEHAARRGATRTRAGARRGRSRDRRADARRRPRAGSGPRPRSSPEGPEYARSRTGLLAELASALRGSGELESCREALTRALEQVPREDTAERVRLEAGCATVGAGSGAPRTLIGLSRARESSARRAPRRRSCWTPGSRSTPSTGSTSTARALRHARAQGRPAPRRPRA